jgi:hypothetical protein
VNRHLRQPGPILGSYREPEEGSCEHASADAVRADIEAFLARHVRRDGTDAIRNPFRYAVSEPIER